MSLNDLTDLKDDLTDPKDDPKHPKGYMKIPLYSINSYFDYVKPVIVSEKFTQDDLTTAQDDVNSAIVSVYLPQDDINFAQDNMKTALYLPTTALENFSAFFSIQPKSINIFNPRLSFICTAYIRWHKCAKY